MAGACWPARPGQAKKPSSLPSSQSRQAKVTPGQAKKKWPVDTSDQNVYPVIIINDRFTFLSLQVNVYSYSIVSERHRSLVAFIPSITQLNISERKARSVYYN